MPLYSQVSSKLCSASEPPYITETPRVGVENVQNRVAEEAFDLGLGAVGPSLALTQWVGITVHRAVVAVGEVSEGDGAPDKSQVLGGHALAHGELLAGPG